VFVARSNAALSRCLRMGYSAIPGASVEAGVRELAQA
jgi:hypothetical protein